MSEKRSGFRWGSCLKGQVRTTIGGAVDCLIRDFSSEGARIQISAGTLLPEHLDIYFPLKQATFRARVCWRREDEVGLAFEAPETTKPSDPVQAQLVKEVQRVNAENGQLRLERDQLRIQLEGMTAGKVVHL